MKPEQEALRNYHRSYNQEVDRLERETNKRNFMYGFIPCAILITGAVVYTLLSPVKENKDMRDLSFTNRLNNIEMRTR